MSIIHRSALVNYTPAQMFNLVDSIEKYPQFLPWCTHTDIHERNSQEVKATIELSMKGMHRRFTTTNRMQKDQKIEIYLLNGPFKHLEGCWRFEYISLGKTNIIFDLEFEFTNRWISFAFEPVFQQVANSLVHIFVKRADEIYGKQS